LLFFAVKRLKRKVIEGNKEIKGTKGIEEFNKNIFGPFGFFDNFAF